MVGMGGKGQVGSHWSENWARTEGVTAPHRTARIRKNPQESARIRKNPQEFLKEPTHTERRLVQ
jgi:hypothetical protein